MDVNVVLAIGGFILQLVLVLGGAYGFVLLREGKMVEKMEKMHDEQEKRIREIEAENKSIRENYRSRLDAMKDSISDVNVAMSDLRTDLLEAVHTLETNLRESVHRQTENVSKVLNSITMKLADK